MKIIAISDLHGYLPELEPCDIVCICGDTMPLEYDRKLLFCKEWFHDDFIPWAKNLDCKNVIFIAGNHDFFLQDKYTRLHIFDKVVDYYLDEKLIYLQDDLVEVQGLTIYGTPWCPKLQNWAFYKNSEDLEDAFKMIPDNIDILLTHTPPKYVNGVGEIRDVSRLQYYDNFPDHGCMELREAIRDKNIGYIFSGHIHSGNHEITEWRGKKLANVSLKDENYNPTYKPLIIEI